jgi:LPXTG-motif cell wall-anchored protein
MQTWKITNTGPQAHEMGLLRLNPGKTLADALAAGENGPPPYTSLGGMQALNPGNSGWVTLDLQPATYVAICFIPDPATGKSHAELGMVAQFTVAAPAGAAPLPNTGEEAPFPAELPNTGMDTGMPLVLAFLALVLVGTGMTLRRRRA